MQRSTRFILILAVLAALAAALAATAAPLAGSGQKTDPSWVPVTLVYEGDVGGKIEPCG